MTLIKSILVAYDFSENAAEALLQAERLANIFQANLSVLHVINHQPGVIYGMNISKSFEDEIAERLRAGMKKILPQRSFHTIEVAKGNPALLIAAKAQTMDADLVVLGSQGLSGITRLLLGSVAEKVVRLSSVPVYVARENAPVQTYKKILVPIDDSTFSESAIPYAKLFAKKTGAHVQLAETIDITALASENQYSTLMKAMKDYTQGRLDKLNKKHELLESPLILEGPVSYSIAEACRKDPSIGLVVLSTHGKRGIKHLLLGSSAETIVRHAHCSVLTMRPDVIKQELKAEIEDELKKENKEQFLF